MLQRILVPTDGSPESEKPVPIAAQLAQAQGGEVMLVSVVERPSFTGSEEGYAMPPDIYQAMVDAMEGGTRQALEKLQAVLQSQSIPVSATILRGQAASSLLDYEKKYNPDLVVMASHGRTGLARFAMGSVTGRLVRDGTAPVLVTRMSTEFSGSLDRALVMLDGSGRAEESLPLVESLAGKPFKQIKLFRVVPNPADRSAAHTYLEGVAARFTKTGVDTEIVVDIGDPRPTIERAAKDADLVVLCTRGEGGFDRLRHGSVADHVLRGLGTPTLLVRTADR
ncbi:MAG: universal stress protein [Chloroflexi bacterium]|nr:universal stress protein [Chloroflexota bacterium]